MFTSCYAVFHDEILAFSLIVIGFDLRASLKALIDRNIDRHGQQTAQA